MGATIYDIAKKCHVSTTTVSKVFNKAGKISKETTELILKTAEEMGYSPRASARFIAGGSKYSNLIGVLLEINENKGISHELFSKILNSFRIEAEKFNYDICFISKGSKNASYINKIESRGCSGVFCLCALDKKARVEELEKNNIPVVAFDYGTSALSISSDNTESIERMVTHLVNLGHRRIVYVSPDDTEVTTDRRQGFINGLKKNNIELDPRMIVKAPYFSEGSAKMGTDLALASGINPTAIMFPDDYSAINAIPYLRELGYRVPKDISVTGFDGIDVCSLMKPTITTVMQDAKEIGREAAKMLLSAIETGDKEKIHKIIPSTIMEGESVRNILDEEEKK
ncbi:MAG: LacI family transcriptional regulator [Bacilli bacterium]|nr:LacI family transcriptional regulator [Bacilli bacterium]